MELLQRYSRKVREGSLSSTMMDLQPSSLNQTTNLAECAVCHQVLSERYESCVQIGKSSYIHICWHWEILKICFFAANPKRAGALWRRLLLLLSSLFQVRQKFFFQTRKCLKNLWGVQIVIIMNKKPSPQRLISSCNNRFQLEMYFFFCFKVQTVNRITCCSRAKPTLDRLNLKFLQSFLSGCPGPKYWRSAGVWIFPGAI